MFNSLRSTPNNWFAKKIQHQSNMAIPMNNLYSKTGVNHFSRKIKDTPKSGFQFGKDIFGSEVLFEG